jgi:hypothetical protein
LTGGRTPGTLTGMPRRAKGARLYLDPKRHQWIVRDGARFVRTGCDAGNRIDAEQFLAAYIIGQKPDQKHTSDNDPLIDNVLATYLAEHAPNTSRAGNDIRYIVGKLLTYWSGKRVSAITARTCRAYPGGRKHLQILKAAVRFWHRECAPLASLPVFVAPPRGRGVVRSEMGMDRFPVGYDAPTRAR